MNNIVPLPYSAPILGSVAARGWSSSEYANESDAGRPGLPRHRGGVYDSDAPRPPRTCQLTGYPTVDAQAQVDGAAPIQAEQTPTRYLGSPVPGGTVTLTPGHGAHAMLEWIGSVPGPDCVTYDGPSTNFTLRVTPPGMSQTFTVPIGVGRSEGLCHLLVHPVTGD
jgi:hypothetical protein